MRVGKDEKCCINCAIQQDREGCCEECRFEHKDHPSLFYRITESIEVLAEKLVYDWGHLCHNGDIKIYWKSTILPDAVFCSKAEALTATVVKLKEVEKQ
jgi:hypothetical protein